MAMQSLNSLIPCFFFCTILFLWLATGKEDGGERAAALNKIGNVKPEDLWDSREKSF